MKSPRLIARIFASLIAGFALLGFAPLTHAISISPLVFELNANPGDVVTNIIRVYNDQDYPISASVEVENFAASGEEGRVVIEEAADSNTTYALAKWVKVSEPNILLEPHSFRAIEFKIEVPKNAEPGGHYGSVLASISGGTAQGGGTGVAQKIGSLLLLNVSGVVHEELSVEEFSAPEYTEYGPAALTLRFKNDGSVHVKPRGFVTIKDILGDEVAKFAIPQDNILPQSIRKVALQWGGKYQVGRYDAILSAIYGSTNEPITAAVRFWILPWKLIIAGLIALILILTLLIKARKRLGLALRILFKGSAATGDRG